MPARLRPVVSIGKIEPSGMRHGMYMPPDQPVESVGDWVNNDPYVAADRQVDYWARRTAAALDAQKGPRCLDLSGWFGERYLAGVGDTIPHIEAVRRTTQYLTRPLDRADLVWADIEGHPENWSDYAILGRALWESEVTGGARICFQGVTDGRYGLEGWWPRLPGLCDASTSYCPTMLPKGRDPKNHLEWIRRCVGGAVEAHLHPMCHVNGAMMTQNSELFEPAEQDLYCRAIKLCLSLGAKTFLVYGLYGHGPGILTAQIDRPKRQVEDRATWAAFKA